MRDQINANVDSQLQSLIQRSRENRLRGLIQPPGAEQLNEESPDSGLDQLMAEEEAERQKAKQGGGMPNVDPSAVMGMMGG